MGVHRLVEQRGPDLIVGLVITLTNADAARERLVTNAAQPFRDPPKPGLKLES